ncbi:hypothetical protein [Nocardiopsis sp. YSL2]|uniref:hypothetical protein n=1 Tax=Nocardiopsis sp. YSL2 TaxID=2939492 RepID=UPI0026F45C5B|nr:hypothetical protein [Nocardiopsis sp. YSL2]
MTTTTRLRSREAEIADRVAIARARWPIASHVVHTATGMRGVITRDTAARVPCGTTGADEDAAWSILPSATAAGGDARRPGWGIAVHVSFTEAGVTWTSWIRTDYLRRIRRAGDR